MLEKIFTFAKAQVSAFVGGMTSYVVTVLLREVFLHHAVYERDINYFQSIVAVGIGEILGAIVNFTINKTWAFKAKGSTYKHTLFVQFSRFVFVVAQSILLKATGVHLLTLIFSKIDFKIWLLFVYFLVSIGNYLLQRYWVFKRVTMPNINIDEENIGKES